jgi:hypothetical protein
LNFHPKSKSNCSRGATADIAEAESDLFTPARLEMVRAQAERDKSDVAERSSPPESTSRREKVDMKHLENNVSPD